MEFKYPMTDKSVKSRFLPSTTNLYTRLLPAYIESLESEDDRDEGEDSGEKDSGEDSGRVQCEKESQY